MFLLRDTPDHFRLYVQGRAHADGIVWAGPGLSSLGPDNALSFVTSYWATRHVRVSANYVYYALPDRSRLTTLHEMSFRFGVQF